MSSSPVTLTHFSSEYALSLLAGLYSQLNTGEFCDVTLNVTGQSFPAHKNILAAASPYFHAMFTGGLSESDKPLIHLQGASPDIFQVLLKFMYTGDVDITTDICEDLLVAADLYNIHGVLEACCLFLQKHLHPANCLGIYQLAETHSCDALKRASEEYINKHFLDVIKEEEFLLLPLETLVHFLASEQLFIDDEVQLLNSAILWIRHDITKRRMGIFQILAVIRFPLIQRSALEKAIEACQDLSLEIAIRKVAQDYIDLPRKSAIDWMAACQSVKYLVRKGARRKVMVIGGQRRDVGSKWCDTRTLSSVEVFDVSRKTHTHAPSMKYARSSHGCAVLNGLVYVLGGERDSLIFDGVECFDPSNDSWKCVAHMVEPRCGHGTAVVNNCLYALGGWVGSENGRSIEMLDPEVDEWAVVDRMTSPRNHMGTVAHRGLIYVLGGIDQMDNTLSVVESYDPVTRKWCRLSDMLTRRSHLGVCVGDDMIYVVGGMNGDEGPLESIERYDIVQNKWSSVTMLPSPRAGAGVAYANGQLFVFGGWTSSDPLYTVNDVDCYDPVSNCWQSLEPLDTGRAEATVIIL